MAVVIPTSNLPDSIAEIVQILLTNDGLGVLPSVGGLWPTYRANEPDTPDNCVTVFETEGERQGRYMIGGAYVRRFGFNIRVRSHSYDTGYTKAKNITKHFEEDIEYPRILQITSSTEYYEIGSVSTTSGPIPLGKSIEDSKRYLFSANFTAYVRWLRNYIPT